MAKKKVPISLRAMIERINRKLAAKGQILMTTRKWGRVKLHYDYYILDLSGNVIEWGIDPETLAHKLGVLKEGEEVKPRSRKTRRKS